MNHESPQDPIYTAAECRIIGLVAIILADHYCVPLSGVARAGYEYAVETIYSWALEFYNEEPSRFQDSAASIQDHVTLWGEARFKRFLKEQR